MYAIHQSICHTCSVNSEHVILRVDFIRDQQSDEFYFDDGGNCLTTIKDLRDYCGNKIGIIDSTNYHILYDINSWNSRTTDITSSLTNYIHKFARASRIRFACACLKEATSMEEE
jgi:hypothetical protein